MSDEPVTPAEGPLGFPDDQADRSAGADAEPTRSSVAEVPPPAPPARASRYGWLVGVVFVIAVGYISVNTLRTHGTGSRGLQPGAALPAFAMPLALSNLGGDANVAQRPGQGAIGRVPACSVRRPDVLNSCVETTAPLVLAFAFTGAPGCYRVLDEMQSLQRSRTGVRFAAVFSRGGRGDLRRLIRSHGWTFPVGYDRDGAVANLYGISGCPTVTYTYPGGTAMRTRLGSDAARNLAADVRALATASAQRARRTRTPRTRTP
ncbi:MAG TPA: hypothetical protein VHE14_06295 [Solirubrobacteraceae bacterium]|nr:hypothetical protein [Solirubrobacteraceae bacterium]